MTLVKEYYLSTKLIWSTLDLA